VLLFYLLVTRHLLLSLLLEQRQALLHAVTRSVDGENLGVVQQPVEQRTGQHVIAEERSPLGEALVAREDQAARLIAGIDEVEQQGGLPCAEARVADLVDDEHLGTGTRSRCRSRFLRPASSRSSARAVSVVK